MEGKTMAYGKTQVVNPPEGLNVMSSASDSSTFLYEIPALATGITINAMKMSGGRCWLQVRWGTRGWGWCKQGRAGKHTSRANAYFQDTVWSSFGDRPYIVVYDGVAQPSGISRPPKGTLVCEGVAHSGGLSYVNRRVC